MGFSYAGTSSHQVRAMLPVPGVPAGGYEDTFFFIFFAASAHAVRTVFPCLSRRVSTSS